MKTITVIKYTLFATICLLSLVGCESLVNDVDPGKLPKMESKLVVECYISPQAKSIQAVVTESQPLFGIADNSIKVIKDAKVTISGPAGQIVIPFIDSLNTYILPSVYFKIEAGKTYHLTIVDPKRTVHASCTVPTQSVPLKRYTLNAVEGPVNPWDTTSRSTTVKTRFYWDDIASEKNYYTLRGFINIDQNQYGYNPATGIRGMFRYENKNTFYLRGMIDNNADGMTLNSDVMETRLINYTNEYRDENGKIVRYKSDTKIKEIYVEILTIDENYYKFQQTMGQDSGENPFIEPTLVYTNIVGGLGCFGAFNASGTSIKP
jgi:hypothetical protein